MRPKEMQTKYPELFAEVESAVLLDLDTNDGTTDVIHSARKVIAFNAAFVACRAHHRRSPRFYRGGTVTGRHVSVGSCKSGKCGTRRTPSAD